MSDFHLTRETASTTMPLPERGLTILLLPLI
jgi:hypothetical protein